MMLDSVLVTLALCLALVTGGDGAAWQYAFLPRYLAAAIVICLPVFHSFSLYHRMWRYASIGELLAIAGAAAVSSALMALYAKMDAAGLPASILMLNFFYLVVLTGLSRLFISIMQQPRPAPGAKLTKILVVGAGEDGIMTARRLKLIDGGTKALAGFVDDDPDKADTLICGYKVLGSCKDIKELACRHKVDEIIIAMPAARTGRLYEIIVECLQTGSSVKVAPHLYELLRDVSAVTKTDAITAGIIPADKTGFLATLGKTSLWVH